MTVPVVRKRAVHSKNRTGCRTCRARHVRCDEGKPICRNCYVSEKECLGYDPVKPSRHSRLAPLQPTEVALPVVRYSPSNFPGNLRTEDGYALNCFLHAAFADLPGSKITLAWDRLILPFCRWEPAVMHAAMAIGALQQHRCANDSMKAETLATALTQYGRSASIVRTVIEQHGQIPCEHDVESILTASLLLFCFDLLTNVGRNAAMHLRSGMKIVHEQSQTKRLLAAAFPSHLTQRKLAIELPTSNRSRMDVLTQTFVRLDADLIGRTDRKFSPICRRPIPNVLDSLDEAMVYTDVLHGRVGDINHELDVLAWDELERTYQGFSALEMDVQTILMETKTRVVALDPMSEIVKALDEVKQMLARIMAAVAALPAPIDFRDERRLLITMQLFCIHYDIIHMRCADEMEMDGLDEQLEYMLEVAEQYFTLTRQEKEKKSMFQSPGFGLGTSVGHVMWIIVERSRKTSIRMRATSLMAKMELRGPHDGIFLGSFYRHVVKLEESAAKKMLGLPEGHEFQFNEIPAAARSAEVDIVTVLGSGDNLWVRDGVGRMLFTRLEPDGRISVEEDMFPVGTYADGKALEDKGSPYEYVKRAFWEAEIQSPLSAKDGGDLEASLHRYSRCLAVRAI